MSRPKKQKMSSDEEKMEVDGDIQIEVDVMKLKKFEIKRGKDTTIAGLKDVIKGMPEVQTKWPSLDNINRIRVLAQGERLTDSTTLSKFSGTNGNDRKAIVRVIILPEPEQQNEVFTVLNTTRILNNNVRECMKSALELIKPADRVRFNEPEYITPDKPTMNDLALVQEEIAASFKLAAEAHEKLADYLKRIESPDIQGDYQQLIDETRSTIQNTLDGNRYCSPMLKNLSRVIPKFGDDNLLEPLEVVQLAQRT